jgi:hypothetical protein
MPLPISASASDVIPFLGRDAEMAVFNRWLDDARPLLVAQGNLPDALKSYGDSLAIAEHLATADPGKMQWQVDLLRAHRHPARQSDDAARRSAFIVSTLRSLKGENKLTAEQASWL